MKKIAAGIGSKALENLIANALDSKGIDRHFFGSDAELLSGLENFEFDAVLIKTGFDRRDDRELVGRIRSNFDSTRLPLVMLLEDEDQQNPDLRKQTPFTINIPFSNDELSTLVDKALAEKRKKILAADDSVSIRAFIKNHLHEDYDLTIVEDGRKAIEALEKKDFDLVITDVEMPNVNGYELCRYIRGRLELENIPVIMASTLSQGFNIEKGFEAGASDYLTKPLDGSELLSRIQSILSAPQARKREKIVVVDDSRTVRNIVVSGLSQQGFDVVSAENGEEGFELIEQVKPDLVVTDAIMPIADGYELCRRLKSDPNLSSIPIVFLSSKETTGAQRRGIAIGASVFITKPFQVDKLVVIIERLLSEQRSQKEAKQLRSTFQKYFSQQVADWILNNPEQANLSGQQITATVIYTDVRGFTKMCDNMDAKAIVSIMNRYFTKMEDVIFDYHGAVDKFIGDAILAVFGVPRSMGNDALMAVRSAAGMNRALEQFNKQQKKRGEPELGVGIGITTGAVVAGNVGSNRRVDYTVMGSTVNLAARLQHFAVAGEIIFDQPTLDAVADFVEVEELPPLSVKGFKDKVQTYKLVSVSDDLKREEDSDE